MLMGNPNLGNDEDEEEEEDDEDSEAAVRQEEDEMDNVEALMAGVGIEEKDKVRIVHALILRLPLTSG
jgi:hypothetical protein